MRSFAHRILIATGGAAILAVTTGCQVTGAPNDLSASLLTFAEDLFRQILAAFLL